MLSAAVVLLGIAGTALAAPFNSTLSKRTFTNARFTHFDTTVGLGACGHQNKESDFIVALNQAQWSTSHCFDSITISYNGKTATATIVDLCPDCPYGALDLTDGLFNYFTWAGAANSATDPGVIYGSWDFTGSKGSANGGAPVSGGGSTTSPPPPPPPPASGSGNRIHPNGDTSKCLDVQGAVFANGTPVQIYDCNGTSAQNWVINSGETVVQLAGTNYCLDAGTTPGNGVQMKIWQCYSGLAQQTWYYTDDQRIALENQGLCLDDTNGSHNDGTITQIWKCTDNDNNQVWTLS